MSVFEGIFTPIVTPFDSRGNVNYDDLEFNINKWNTTPLAGLVVLGTNGEFPYLTKDERLDIVKFCKEKMSTDKKLIVGSGFESTQETIDFSTEVGDIGVDAVLVLPPHYYKKLMNEDALFKYYSELGDNIDVPIMLYNMPMNTGINMSSKLVSKLSMHPNIVGIKDTAGNIVQLSEIVRDSHKDFTVFAGNAGYILPALTIGARGGTVALGNCLPEDCCKIVELFNNQEYDKAKKLQLDLLKINYYVTGLYGIPALKKALNYLGYRGGHTRRPLQPLSSEIEKEVIKVIEEYRRRSVEC